INHHPLSHSQTTQFVPRRQLKGSQHPSPTRRNGIPPRLQRSSPAAERRSLPSFRLRARNRSPIREPAHDRHHDTAARRRGPLDRAERARLQHRRRQGHLDLHPDPQEAPERQRRRPLHPSRRHLRCPHGAPGSHSPHLPGIQARNAIRQLARPPLAHGLGHPPQGPPLGEPAHGLAVVGRHDAGHQTQLQVQGGRHPLCREARVRVLCPGAAVEADQAQGVRQQLFVLAQEAQAHSDQVERDRVGAISLYGVSLVYKTFQRPFVPHGRPET
ncbi:hypothetical protein CABS03_09459, partial [Colletotrichum abscissum]